MRRLYLQIYLMVLGIIVLFAVIGGISWRVFGPSRDDEHRMISGASNIVARLLPPAGAPSEEQQAALESLASDLDMRLTLRGTDGAVLAHVGEELSAPNAKQFPAGSFHRHDPFALRLDDGRIVLAAGKRDHDAGILAAIAALAAAIALGAYPVVRRITRRVETLRAQVDALGSGDLAARVEVRGKDEIADLAASFNRAAERIERLIAAQRGALAAASHELRSPLARIRMAIELLQGQDGDELRARVGRDVAELDALIGELLLASRLDALEPGEALDRREAVDLLGLAAEECARTGAQCAGDPAMLWGDPALLRRLIRNLLENARRYAGAAPVEVRVQGDAKGRALIAVSDRGPGVPEDERERVFEPFYRRKGASESKDGGVGLGLALVRQIAHHHGGDVRCLAREGGGTTFEVVLESPRTKPKDTAGVVIKPPTLVVGTLVLGSVLEWLVPTPVPGGVPRIAAGLAVVAGGIALMVAAMRTFRRAGTNVETDRPTHALVTHGVYAYTRNPIYLALSAIYLGIGVANGSLWVLGLYVPLFLVLRFGVIEREERYLERLFDGDYLAYRARVRRFV